MASRLQPALQGMRIGFFSALLALVVQFMLGMAVNLFVMVPLDHPGARPAEYFSGVVESVTWAILHGPVLLILYAVFGHAVFGLLLVAAAIQLMVQAIQSHLRNLIVISVIGALAVLAAGFNGGSYLNYHEDFSSMLMATFFAMAMIAYAIGLYVTARPQSA